MEENTFASTEIPDDNSHILVYDLKVHRARKPYEKVEENCTIFPWLVVRKILLGEQNVMTANEITYCKV
jgi:hypothetical protein